MRHLSDNLEVVQTWFAAYAQNGVRFSPEAIAQMITTLADLKRQAEGYEDLISIANQLRIALRTEGLTRRDRIQAALDAKGLGDTVRPASALLTEEHLRDPKIVPFPCIARLPVFDPNHGRRL